MIKYIICSYLILFSISIEAQVSKDCICKEFRLLAKKMDTIDFIDIYVLTDSNKYYYVIVDSNQSHMREPNAAYLTLEIKVGNKYNLCIKYPEISTIDWYKIFSPRTGYRNASYWGGGEGFLYITNDIQKDRIIKRGKNDRNEYSIRSPLRIY